eukprot:761888-Hanusia_phi.AAC.2
MSNFSHLLLRLVNPSDIFEAQRAENRRMSKGSSGIRPSLPPSFASSLPFRASLRLSLVPFEPIHLSNLISLTCRFGSSELSSRPFPPCPCRTSATCTAALSRPNVHQEEDGNTPVILAPTERKQQ